jgi:DNA repair exonuclease SbcCD ATPase subunit
MIDAYKDYIVISDNLKATNILIEKEIAKLSSDKSALQVKLGKRKEKTEILVDYVDSLKTYKGYSEQLADNILKEKELGKVLSDFKGKLEEFEEIKPKLEEYDDEENTLSSNLKKVVDNLNDIEVKSKLIENYFERKSILEIEYRNTQLVTDALSPVKGIPVIKMNSFIVEIKNYANSLLAKTFEGSFQLDFIITEDEFRIPFIKSDGTVGNDIQMASQGELAIATMAVSFAILLFAIKQSGMRYNIVYCDEIDAELDIDNRLMFKYILEQQLEDLKVEQCFIVSHNESFNDQECYSVLLSKNDFTSKFKRNVLFSAFDKKKKLK